MGVLRILALFILLVVLVVLHGATVLTADLTNLGVMFLRDTSKVTGWIAAPVELIMKGVRYLEDGVEWVIRKLSFGHFHLRIVEREFEILNLFVETFEMLADFDNKCKGAKTMHAALLFAMRDAMSPWLCADAQLLMLKPDTRWAGDALSFFTFDPRGTNTACTSSTDRTCLLVWGLPLVLTAATAIVAAIFFGLLLHWEIKMAFRLLGRALAWLQDRMLALDFSGLPTLPDEKEVDSIPLVGISPGHDTEI